MAIDTAEFQTLVDSVAEVLGTASIVISKKTLGDFNPVTQKRAESLVAVTVNAVRHPRRVAFGNPRGMDTKENFYSVRVSDMGSTVPAQGDTLQDGSRMLSIEKVELAVNDQEFEIYCMGKA